MIRNYQKEDIGMLMNIWLQGNIDAHYFIEKIIGKIIMMK